MPKTLILSKGQQKSMGGKKPKGKLKNDQTKHLQGWTTNPIEANWKTKCLITKRTIKGQWCGCCQWKKKNTRKYLHKT